MNLINDIVIVHSFQSVVVVELLFLAILQVNRNQQLKLLGIDFCSGNRGAEAE